MKRALGIALTLASLGFAGFISPAKATELSQSNMTLAANASPQMAQLERDRYRDRYGRRVWNRRRMRAVTRSRVVRVGRRVYRETYLVRYLPNGLTDTRLISRIRIA